MSDAASQAAKCPTCDGEVAADSVAAPFCSDRCKWVDLGRWLRGDYVIPAEDAVDFGDEVVPPESEAVGGDPDHD